MKDNPAFGLALGCCFLLLLTAGTVSAQSISEMVHPLVDGERAMRFRVNTGGARPGRLDVTVFYSEDAAELDNLDDASLSRGRPVLERDPRNDRLLNATFVFPHQDFESPNRALYFKYRDARNRDVVRYPDLDGQLSVVIIPELITEPSPADVNPEIHRRKRCIYYRIRIKTDPGRPAVFTSDVASFRMPHSYNVGLAGDSYGSGEGAPDGRGPRWKHDDCHRSNKSGLVRGVKRFISERPEVSVDYQHVACSGALIRHLTERQREGFEDFRTFVPAQFTSLELDLLRDSREDELHLLVLSVGGNDAGFGGYLVRFYFEPNVAPEATGVADDIRDALARLAGSYRDLSREISGRFPTASVAIATYPDPTQGRLGPCGFAATDGQFRDEYGCCLFEVNPFNPVGEYSFTRNNFVRPLNSTISEAARTHGWRLIDVEGRIGEHGVCNCVAPYVNTLDASLSTQDDPSGYFHLNAEGYREVYQAPVAKAVGASYEDFVRERTAAMFFALLLGIETPLIPAACPSPEAGGGGLWQLFRFVSQAPPVWASRLRSVRVLLADKDVKAAALKGDLKRFRSLPAYRTLAGRRAELTPYIRKALARPAASPASSRLPSPPPSVLRGSQEARAYFKSREFKSLLEKHKSAPPAGTSTKEKDVLDDLFNRQRPD